MNNNDQYYETYLPVYDYVPEEWDNARPFFLETFKKISNAVNSREIGWYLDEELISGKQMFPSDNDSSQSFRTIFRKVIDCSPLTAGVNVVPHGITFDINFTLIQIWVSATNSSTFVATTLSNSNTVNMDATNINITSPGSYDRAFAFVEYILEQ
jgi:hypothetical protein